ncbi:MAG: hypothetical protein AB7I79_20515 [Rhizobiaceae bacterium]
MLKTALVAMTVIGCDCDAKMCEFVRATPAEWSTIAECETALKGRALKDRDSGYPLLMAICRSTEESPIRLASAPDMEVAPATPAEPGEETRSILVRASDGVVVARNFAGELAGGATLAVGGALNIVSGAGGWVVSRATNLF